MELLLLLLMLLLLLFVSWPKMSAMEKLLTPSNEDRCWAGGAGIGTGAGGGGGGGDTERSCAFEMPLRRFNGRK